MILGDPRQSLCIVILIAWCGRKITGGSRKALPWSTKSSLTPLASPILPYRLEERNQPKIPRLPSGETRMRSSRGPVPRKKGPGSARARLTRSLLTIYGQKLAQHEICRIGKFRTFGTVRQRSGTSMRKANKLRQGRGTRRI